MKLELKYEDGIYKGYCEGVYINPLEFGSVDEITLKNFIHRAPSLEDLFYILYALLKVGGKAIIIAPYYTSAKAWEHLETKRSISEHTFYPLSKAWRENNPQVLTAGYECDFKIDFQFEVDPEWANRTPEQLAFAVKHYWNVAKTIRVELVKI